MFVLDLLQCFGFGRFLKFHFNGTNVSLIMFPMKLYFSSFLSFHTQDTHTQQSMIQEAKPTHCSDRRYREEVRC